MTISQWMPMEATDVWTMEFPPCPICGDPIDYCLGHGERNGEEL